MVQNLSAQAHQLTQLSLQPLSVSHFPRCFLKVFLSELGYNAYQSIHDQGMYKIITVPRLDTHMYSISIQAMVEYCPSVQCQTRYQLWMLYIVCDYGATAEHQLTIDPKDRKKMPSLGSRPVFILAIHTFYLIIVAPEMK